jgi:hypothetical protein
VRSDDRIVSAEEMRRFKYGDVAFWCDDCGAFELEAERAIDHAEEFGHAFWADPDWFQEGNEELFAWRHVEIGPDDRTLTFRGIHAPKWIEGPSPKRWGFSRVELVSSDDALGARVWLIERRPGEPDALDGDDPSRTVTATLETPLDGRVVYDGCAGLQTPAPESRRRAVRTRWERVQVFDDQTLVVYWTAAGNEAFDHVSTHWSPDTLFVGLWATPGTRMSGRWSAAIARLDRPLGDRDIRRQRDD